MNSPRPLALKIAISLFVVEMVAAFSTTLLHVWLLVREGSNDNYHSLVLATLVLPVVECGLLWWLAQGSALARYAIATIVGALLISHFSSFGPANPAEMVRDFLSLGLMLAGTAFTFVPSVSRWLRSQGGTGA